MSTKLDLHHIPRSDSGTSSIHSEELISALEQHGFSSHSELTSDDELECLLNKNDSGVQDDLIPPSPTTPLTLSRQQKRPSLTPHSLPKSAINIDLSQPDKVPRFTNSSPSWCSLTSEILPQYKSSKPDSCPETILSKHPDITPKMRAILLDWLIEVSEVHFLHRQTFYLASNYIDTYLSKCPLPLSRANLQLLGITCLLIAAKLEEIYPPKAEDLAFLTDGACEADDILTFEVQILQVLEWRLQPTTILDWICLFLQQAYYPKSESEEEFQYYDSVSKRSSSNLSKFSRDVSNSEIAFRYFPDSILVQMMQLCDVMCLDINTTNFKQENLAAAVLYHFSAASLVKKATGFVVDDIKEAIGHVTKFAVVMKEHGFNKGKQFDRLDKSDWLNIQTHIDQLALFETVV